MFKNSKIVSSDEAKIFSGLGKYFLAARKKKIRAGETFSINMEVGRKYAFSYARTFGSHTGLNQLKHEQQMPKIG